jgi:hypothetical protein
MKVSDLLVYLLNSMEFKKMPFSPQEMWKWGSEPLIMVYGLIIRAVISKCKVIELTSEEVIFRKEINGEATFRQNAHRISWSSFFEFVRTHDKTIQPILLLIEKSDELMIYQINWPLLDWE